MQRISNKPRRSFAGHNFRRVTAAAALLALVAFSASEAQADWWKFGQRKLRETGHIEIKSYDLSGFESVTLKSVADVEITFGPEYRVEVETDEVYLELMDIDVRRKTLVIDMDDDDYCNLFLRSEIIVRITMPALEEIRLKGVGDMIIENFEGQTLEVTLSGIGDIEIDGTVGELDISVSGIGDANLRQLQATDAWATVSGMGDLRLSVSGTLDARVSGFGDIIYYGHPKDVNRSVSGFGDILSRR
ncbi:MAG: DUF2807 domain-containing protein [candidate division Zixibacteria bacterium]|nr:DUF2807 domain-containing protein [candidate division Zixibacteria bacterium]